MVGEMGEFQRMDKSHFNKAEKACSTFFKGALGPIFLQMWEMEVYHHFGSIPHSPRKLNNEKDDILNKISQCFQGIMIEKRRYCKIAYFES